MKKTVSAILIIVLVAAFLPISTFCDATEPAEENAVFDVTSPFAAIVNADTGTELFAKNADTPFFCAFLPRIMTCILLVESGLDLSTVITLSKEMMAVSHDKSSANLVSGNKISLYDLMKCILVANSQEACIAVAVTLAGDVSEFIVQMNKRARELGAESTVFTNVTGQYSSATKQTTTAHDVVKICMHALNLEYIEDLSNYRYVDITVNNSKKSIYTHNSLVDRNSSYYIKKASGLAISGNNTTGYALVSVAVDKAMRIVCFALNYESVSNLYADLSNMINFSLTEYAYRTLIQKNAPVIEIPVVFGKERDTVTLVASSTVSASLPSSVPDSKIVADKNIPDKVDAPIAKGTVLGSVTYSYDGRVYGTTELIAQSDISLDVIESYSAAINGFFSNKYIWAAIITVVFVVIFYSTVLYIKNRKKMRREESNKRNRITKMPR